VAEFIGTPRINMIQGSIQDGIFSSLEGSVRFSAPVHYAGAVLLGLRPEHLSPAEGPVSLRAQVLITEPLGANTVLTLKVGGLELKALLPGEPPEERELQMSFDPAKALFFEPRTGRRID
jgi:ABC-type sugar transport system ATPase subunit